MFFITTLAAAAAIAQATPAQWTHSVPVDHGRGQATAIYEARPVVSTRQIGTSMGTRMSTARCLWTADIAVERRLETSGVNQTGTREMAAVKTLKGSRHGACATSRGSIDKEIAAQTPAIRAHLVAVAERDQQELRTEIDTLAPPAGR
ncbi:hypothetical protein [Polymorphobacter fuscus]|uniref:hypothetical protein n=1 Tax=Sandarakinorhabdus fusca TaxID=1439888 RepID=UPI00143129C3|nr:hypothetical protein [Polymorphobacter fuscus]NJC09214.1 hypothetical protein [Polymorphobacter fuscus]